MLSFLLDVPNIHPGCSSSLNSKGRVNLAHPNGFDGALREGPHKLSFGKNPSKTRVRLAERLLLLRGRLLSARVAAGKKVVGPGLGQPRCGCSRRLASALLAPNKRDLDLPELAEHGQLGSVALTPPQSFSGP